MHCDLGRFTRNNGRLGIGLADVDSALEEGAILDADASRRYVAGESTLGANVDAVSGVDVALELSKHDDFTSADAGGHLAVLTHRDAIAGDGDAAFDLSVDKERFRSGNLALDREAFADAGLLA